MSYSGNKIVTLGEYLAGLKRAYELTPDEVRNMAAEFCDLLAACDFSNTLHAAGSLKNLPELHTIAVTQKLSSASAAMVHNRTMTVAHMLYGEARQKNYIALDPSVVSGQFKSFRSKVPLTQAQEAMIDETVRCMETGCYRTAFVMAWNSIYDIVRQWVFDNRLSDFNDAIKHKYSHKLRGITEVTNYSDFWEHTLLGEWDVLDACSIVQSGPIISGKSFDRLCGFLRDRNDHAHPNFRVPTASKVNSYVENLLDVVADPPFKLLAN